MHVRVLRVQTETRTGVGPGFMRPEAFTVSGSRFKKKEYKIMNTKCEYIFRMRKEISANYRFLKKLTNATYITKSRKIT